MTGDPPISWFLNTYPQTTDNTIGIVNHTTTVDWSKIVQEIHKQVDSHYNQHYCGCCHCNHPFFGRLEIYD